ncbi:hypothetical protein C8A00DRAFT_11047 [Chaetomidium leptoderma]|uniref:Uncharacterized protein n=1 Tax=Chaetomidium leptoderma TaxID=669021 RepID=A0AAN7A2N2_9PEZI|nr:hypothetical protein C8A00DRAFT_11047 [Chaetomidium leptoderma]
MPGLTIVTNAGPASTTARSNTNLRRASTSSQASSPSRPPISPITPTLGSAQLPTASPAGPVTTAAAPATMATTTHASIPDFALGRPVFTHTTQTEQVGIAPPPAQPIDFDSNPDVLALKSAISILQLQRARATADIQSLSRARDAALANPEAFAADLESGRVRVEGDPLFSGAGRAGGLPGDDSDSDSESESDPDEQQEPEDGNVRQEVTPGSEDKTDSDNADMADAPNPRKPKPKGKHNPNTTTTTTDTTQPPPWHKLPKPQSVVRCPPINWAQYGVIGESLDKLHAEQVAAPTPGAPIMLSTGGTYAFRAGEGGTSQGGSSPAAGGQQQQQQRRLVGIAAPYNPMRDKLEKKGKGGTKR